MVRSSVLVFTSCLTSWTRTYEFQLGLLFSFYVEFTTREYESYEHANAISESELVNTATLESTALVVL